MRSLALRGAILAAALVAAGPAQAAADEAPARLEMSYDGPTLVTPAGMSLYLHSNENLNAERYQWQCTDVPPATIDENTTSFGIRPQRGFQLLKSCVQKFPPYLADANASPTGDFSIVRRPDGARQWAYRGFPLYLSVRDHKPGDRNGAVNFGFGAGAGGRAGTFRLAWMAVTLPTGFKFARREEGLVLTTAVNDKMVYTPRNGKQLVRTSIGDGAFQPIAAAGIATASGDWSIVDHGDGVRHYAFRGKPLYAAPPGVTEQDIARAGGWDPVVVYKGPGRPSAIGKRMTLLGEVYTNARGMTLYTYNCNALSGAGLPPRFIPVTCEDAGDPAAYMVANCGDAQSCAQRWHPYFAPGDAKPEGEFSIVEITYPVITDPRGTLYPPDAPRAKVWAWCGKPLFTYYEDTKPGDMWGNNIGGLWGSSFTALEVPGKSAINFDF